jgi:hypothetical protein
MVTAALLAMTPICVLGKVIIDPARMSKVVVNIADAKTHKMVTKMPPTPNGGFMMFLDPGSYRMRLVGLKGEPIGPVRNLVVEKGMPARVCLPSTSVAAGKGRLEGWLDIQPLTPTQKEGETGIPPVGMFKDVTVTLAGTDGKPLVLKADTYGIFTADLKPGDYNLTTNFKTPSPITPVKVSIKAGQLSTVRWKIDSGIR